MSFFSSVENFFKKFVKNTTWEQTVSAGIGIAAPGLESIIALTAGESDASTIQSVVSETQTDLATLTGLLAQSKAGTNASATIVNVLNAVKSNLSSLLTAGHIKDATTLTKVTAVVNGVIEEIEAVLPLIPIA
jgi:hypothetical protein